MHLPGLAPLSNLRAARAEIKRAPPAADGLEPSADGVRASELPSFSMHGKADRVLAEIDQDGYAFPLEACDADLFRPRAERLPKRRYRLQVVLREGIVCVRCEDLAIVENDIGVANQLRRYRRLR